MVKITCFTTDKLRATLEPVLMILSDGDEAVNKLIVLREFEDSGDPKCSGWVVSDQVGLDKVKAIVEKKKLKDSFIVTGSDSKNFNVVDNIMRKTVFPGKFQQMVGISVSADFWNAARLNANRPPSHGENSDVFTFEALKEMWRAIGKGGFSSKSKTDLYEGFAESASEMATGPESTICDKLPAKMIKLESSYNTTKLKTNFIAKNAAQVLALTSRTSGKVLYNKESSPEITNDTIRVSHVLVDIVDFYGDPSIEDGFSTDQEALEVLKPVVDKG